MCRKTIFIILFLVLMNGSAHAEAVRLNKLIPVQDVRLTGADAIHRITLPIAERWQVKRATLTLDYSNSSALLGYKSRLTILVDGFPVHQAVLDPNAGGGRIRAEIPGPLLDPGYHEIVFSVAAHSEEECEDPFAPELWVALALGSATLEIEKEKRPIPESLSSIPTFMADPKIVPAGRVNLVLPDLSSWRLSAAAIVSAGLGARFEYRPVFITVSNTPVPDVDNVFIGTYPEAEGLFKKRGVELPQGESILVASHLPVENPGWSQSAPEDVPRYTKDRRHLLIVVSGQQPQGVELAAKAMAHLSAPYPESGWIEVEEARLPSLSLYTRKGMLLPGSAVTFSSLGFDTKVFTRSTGESVKLSFVLPGDLYIRPNEYAAIELHFAYSASMRRDSSMHILVNGKPVESIGFENEAGAAFEGYRLLIPAYLFRPGRNFIEFVPHLVPLVQERCARGLPDSLFLTIFDDSTISFPEMGNWGKLPSLSLFFDTGFPFTRDGSGAQTSFLLPILDRAPVELALNLSAFLGQQLGYAPTALDFATGLEGLDDREVLVIGTWKDIPSLLKERAPLEFGKQGARLVYPVMVRPEHSASKRSGPLSWLDELMGNESERPVASSSRETAVLLAKNGEIGKGQALLMEFESPLTEGRSVLLWTSTEPESLSASVWDLWLGTLRGAASGDTAIFRAGPDGEDGQDRIFSASLGPTYYTGDISEKDKADFYLRRHKGLYFGLLAVSVVLLAFVAAALLRRRAKARLQEDARDHGE